LSTTARQVIDRTRARLKIRTRLRAFADPTSGPARPTVQSGANGAAPRKGPAPLTPVGPGHRTTPQGTWRIEPGTGFFDRHPRFLDTSEVAANNWRLNLRHEAIITANKDVLEGAEVLDIASHDGRWTAAALLAGARHVVGAEGRPELVEHAAENLAHYGIGPDRYRFIVGDLFSTLEEEKPQADVVLCLGFLYHTMRYDDVFRLMRQSNAEHLVLDTRIEPSDEPVMRVRTNGLEGQGSAFTEDPISTGQVLVGRPSVPALRRMARVYGYELDRYPDWFGILEDNPDAREVGVYKKGLRATLRFRRDRSLDVAAAPEA